MADGESGSERLRQELQFRKALVALTNDLLSSELDATFYQTALERTVELVPDAEGGSVMIRHDDGLYHFEAAVEFDFEVLKSVALSDAELGERRAEARIEKIEIQDYEERLGADKADHFRDAGKLEEIRATLSVPLRVGDETMGYFNLDNFTSPEAFTETDIEIAEAIAAQVSLALYRLFLERRLQQEREHFQHMAHHDPLTGLPNRRLFLDSLDRAIALAVRRGSKIGLLFVDLDAFKSINDAYGHAAGDHVLIEVGDRIRASVRKGDLPARLGGDEFGVILVDVNGVSDTRRVAGKLCDALDRPIRYRSEDLHLHASVGGATCPDESAESEELIKLADGDMYRSKTAGKS